MWFGSCPLSLPMRTWWLILTERFHPLHAVCIRSAVFPILQAMVERQDLKIQDYFRIRRATNCRFEKRVSPFPVRSAFVSNVNTPVTWLQLNALLYPARTSTICRNTNRNVL